METLVLYALCTASMFYLGSRAVITSFLWSRYPRKLASFMDCAACSGAWYGALVGYVGGYYLGLDFLGLHGADPTTVAAVALGAITWTPIVAGLMQRGFDTLGSAVEDEPEVESEPTRVRSREIAGTITPREVPIQTITIPAKEHGG